MTTSSNEGKALAKSIDALTKAVEKLSKRVDSLDSRMARLGAILRSIENDLEDYGAGEEYADEDEL